jgi:hypothetical protein
MPGIDATGPQGMGPGTGMGRGPCGAGLRRGNSRGRRQGFRGGVWGQPPIMNWGPTRWGYGPWWAGAAGYGSPPNEAAVLKEEEAYLKGELEAIRKRIAALENSQQ